MNEIDTLIERIKNDRNTDFRFSNSLLHSTAEVFLEYGFSQTKLFLYDKQNKSSKYQIKSANQLLRVLSLMAEVKDIRDDRVVGSLILKSLNDIIGGSKYEKRKKF